MNDPILHMMGIRQARAEFSSYRINLEHRVHQDHPLRRVLAVIDFRFVRAEVAPSPGATATRPSIPSS